MGSCRIGNVILNYNYSDDSSDERVSLATQPNASVALNHPQVTASLAKYGSPSLLKSYWHDICEYVSALEEAKTSSAEGLVSETQESIARARAQAHNLGFGLKPDALYLLKNAINVRDKHSQTLSCWQKKVSAYEQKREEQEVKGQLPDEVGLKYFLSRVNWAVQCNAQKGSGALEEIGKALTGAANDVLYTDDGRIIYDRVSFGGYDSYDKEDVKNFVKRLRKDKNTLDQATGTLLNYRIQYKDLNEALINQYVELEKAFLNFAASDFAKPNEKNEAIQLAADCEAKIGALKKL